MSAPMRVGEMLVEAGTITRAQLNEALRHQHQHGGRLGTNLVELGFIDEKTLATFLAKHHSLPAVTAASIDRIKREVLDLIPATVAEKLHAIPIREDAGKLWVAMTDPTDKQALAELERVSRRPIRTMVCPELLMQYALERHYKVRRQPRVVEVRTTGEHLLIIEDGSRHAPEGLPPAAPPALPVYAPFGSAPKTGEQEALTGYIDEAPPAPALKPAATSALTLKELVQQFLTASGDEIVLDAAIRFLALDIPRVWLFLLQDGELVSWGGRGLDAAAMKGAQARLDELPLLGQALASGEVLAGRIQPGALGKLSAPLRVSGETLGVIVPVRIGKHAVGVMLGVDATLDALRRKPELDKMAQKLDQALHINYLRRLLAQP
jgi:hypothetical protein